MWLALGGSPGNPADEAVNRVTVLRLVQWELVASPVEFEVAILQPVRPGDQHLTPARGAHLVGPVSVNKLPAGGGARGRSTTDLDEHSPGICRCDLELVA